MRADLSNGEAQAPLLEKNLDDATTPQLTMTQHIGLSFYWLPTTLTFASLAAIIMPDQIATMSEDNSTAGLSKSSALGVLIILGAIAQFVGPFIAALSDGTHSPLGNRRWYLVVGTIFLCPGLLLMAWAKNYFLYLFGYIIYQFFSTIAVQPFTAVVADCVPEDQRGTASGWIGLMQFLGNLMGSALGVIQGEGGLSDVDVYLLIVATCLIGMVVGTIFIQDDTSPRQRTQAEGAEGSGASRYMSKTNGNDHLSFTQRLLSWPSFPPLSLSMQLKGFVAAFRASRSFCYLFLVAAVATSAASMYTLYLQYYLKDIIAVQPAAFSAFGQRWAHSAEGAAGVCFTGMQLASALSAVAGGSLSDKYGPHRVIVLATVIAIGSFVLFALETSFKCVLVTAVLQGLSSGLGMAPLWALAVECLPFPDSSARDMSIFYLNVLVPQIVLPLVCAQVLDAYPKLTAYRIMWLGSGVLSLLSLLPLVRVRPKTEMKAAEETRE